MNEKTQEQKKNEGLLLAQLLNQKKVSTHDYNEIMTNAGYSSPATRRKFVTSQTVTFEKRDLCLICSLFGLSPEDFGYPGDYFNSNFSHREIGLFCYNHSKEAEKATRSFTEIFFAEVKKYLLKVEEELLVCDYIDKVRGIVQRENLDYYHSRDKEYYLALEERLAERSTSDSAISYKRIIQVPLGAPVQNFEEGVEFVIEEMFAESFEHLCRCLQKFQDQCEFIVIIRPFRLHTYYLVDGKVALTEYHRYDTHGIPMPDTLFINFSNPNDSEAVGSIYLKACMDEFRRMKNSLFNTNCKLTEPMLKKAVVSLDEKIRSEIELVRSQIIEARKKADEGMGPEAQINIFPNYAPVSPKVLNSLSEWDHNEKRLDVLKARHKNISEKRKILSDIFNLYAPPLLPL